MNQLNVEKLNNNLSIIWNDLTFIENRIIKRKKININLLTRDFCNNPEFIHLILDKDTELLNKENILKLVELKKIDILVFLKAVSEAPDILAASWNRFNIYKQYLQPSYDPKEKALLVVNNEIKKENYSQKDFEQNFNKWHAKFKHDVQLKNDIKLLLDKHLFNDSSKTSVFLSFIIKSSKSLDFTFYEKSKIPKDSFYSFLLSQDSNNTYRIKNYNSLINDIPIDFLNRKTEHLNQYLFCLFNTENKEKIAELAGVMTVDMMIRLTINKQSKNTVLLDNINYFYDSLHIDMQKNKDMVILFTNYHLSTFEHIIKKHSDFIYENPETIQHFLLNKKYGKSNFIDFRKLINTKHKDNINSFLSSNRDLLLNHEFEYIKNIPEYMDGLSLNKDYKISNEQFKNLYSNKAIFLKFITKNNFYYFDLPEDIKNDKDVFLAAIKPDFGNLDNFKNQIPLSLEYDVDYNLEIFKLGHTKAALITESMYQNIDFLLPAVKFLAELDYKNYEQYIEKMPSFIHNIVDAFSIDTNPQAKLYSYLLNFTLSEKIPEKPTAKKLKI